MRSSPDIFLAFRYLRPKRSLVSVITLLSVIGPALGVAVLIIVTAVFDGFDREMKQRLLGLQAHLMVYPGQRSYFESVAKIDDPAPVMGLLESKGLKAAPMIEDLALVQYRDIIEIKSMRGIVPEEEIEITDLKKSIVAGTWDIKPGEVLVGVNLAASLGVDIGDAILVHSPRKLTENVVWDESGEITMEETQSVYLPEEAVVAGLFSVGIHQIDANMIYLHLDQAADVLGLDWGAATAIHCRSNSPFELDDLANELRGILKGYHVVTWQEQNERLFGALQVEKTLTTFLLFFIVIVAAFSIAGTLITSVTQKTRDIGILKAVGMGPGTIAKVFLIQGAVIGFLGTAAGTAVGLLVIRFRDNVADAIARLIGHELFPPELYYLEKIPAWLTMQDTLVIVGMAFIVCVAASLLPALYASFLQPAKALAED